MILVTGSKRSGTSMWMQILAAAGLPVIGERFPRGWEDLVADHNPDGFYESELAAGIYYRTNPHPRSGAYLFPEQTRWHAVKVFVPGLVRTDVAFIDRVIATIRGFRDHAASALRVRADLGERSLAPADPDLLLHPVYEWWSDVFALLRDIATRRHAVHVQSYEGLVDDPAPVVHAVVGWLGRGDPAAAAAAVRPRRRAEAPLDPPLPEGIEPHHVAAFDALHDDIHRGRPLTPAFVGHLNAIDAELRPRLLAHNARLRQAAVDRLAGGAG